jgi:segregation and condensation protein B
MENEISKDALIEAVLFFKGEPVSIKKLAKLIEDNEENVKSYLNTLNEKLTGRGVNLIWNNDEVMLGTSPKASALIEKITKEDLMKDLGKAGLETLSIILYKGPISRREIDYIRGVNSNFILRNLMIRGLIEKVPNENDQRSFLYRATFELLNYIGLQKLEDLPEFEQVKKEIENFSDKKSGEESQEQSVGNA